MANTDEGRWLEGVEQEEEPMTHDPYCPRNATTPPERETVYVVKRVQTPQCACEFIARVRADEDAKSRADERERAARLTEEWLAYASPMGPLVSQERLAAGIRGGAERAKPAYVGHRRDCHGCGGPIMLCQIGPGDDDVAWFHDNEPDDEHDPVP